MGELRGLIERRSRATPTATFLEDARGPRRITYRDLFTAVNDWDERLSRLGVRPGAAVLIDVADPLDFAQIFLAGIATGRCVMPGDPLAPEAELLRLRDAARPAAVVSSRDGDIGVNVLSVETRDDGTEVRGALTLATSGSTGAPKSVRLTEAQLLAVAGNVAGHNQLTAHDRGYNSLPLFHINAEVVAVLSTLVGGSALILDRKFQARGFWDLIAEREITWINAVPAILAILARGEFPARPPRLRFIRSASAPLPAPVRRAVVDAFGPVLVESYGMTEAGSQITATALSPDRSPSGSVGRAIGVQLEIRDGLQPVDAGRVGRIWIRGPGVITGYLDGQARERFDADGWLDTGDLGQLDEAGNLIHVGRADDVINRGGELVHPREIEEVLLSDPRVVDAVVVGRPDDILGEVPVAYVVTDHDGGQLAADLTARCAAHLSRFKRPMELVLTPDLPRAATGKVLRAEVARG